MVDLNAHEAGNGGKKPREAYSSPSLLYSENACLSRRRPRVRVPPLPPFLIGARATYGPLGESSLPSFNIIFSRKRFGTITDV